MKIIKQTLTFDASPREIYDMLMDSKKHSEFTNDKAVIGKKIGDKFSAFSGYAWGKNLKLIPGKRIVQTWTSSDLPEDYFTEVDFELNGNGNKTKLVFTQKNVPDKNYKELVKGWKDFYWEPMREMIKKTKK